MSDEGIEIKETVSKIENTLYYTEHNIHRPDRICSFNTESGFAFWSRETVWHGVDKKTGELGLSSYGPINPPERDYVRFKAINKWTQKGWWIKDWGKFVTWEVK